MPGKPGAQDRAKIRLRSVHDRDAGAADGGRHAGVRVRALALTPAQAATPLLQRPYDLRHSGVTWRLNSGVPPTEFAAWAGHSVEVLMRTYAKCMTGLEDVWTTRMNDTLHMEDGQDDDRMGSPQ